jgi:uncharacterized protein (TIGR03083 family)
MSTTEPTTDDWLAALRRSQQTLASLVTPMSDAEVEAPSYASEWSIAQVLSHLGSGAEIFSLFLAAGRDGTTAPGFEAFQPIWDEWNAKSAAEQAHDGLRADAEFVDELEALDDTQREAWRLEMFGGEQRLADVIRLRLGEHTLHTWDVAVMADPDATLPLRSVELLVDHMDQLVGRAGKSPEQPVAVQITTEEPARDFRLEATGAATALSALDPSDRPTGDATLQLPAEALIRLFYGRLDPDHTPTLDVEGIEVDSLRQMFPGI